MSLERKRTNGSTLFYVVPNLTTAPSRQFLPSTCEIHNKSKVTVGRWRCSVNEPSKTNSNTEVKLNSQAQATDAENKNAQRHDDDDDDDDDDEYDHSLELNSLDQQFQDVLSKDWDNIMSFDPTKATQGPTEKNETKDTDLTDDDKSENKAQTLNSETDDKHQDEEGIEQPVKKRTRRRKTKATDTNNEEDVAEDESTTSVTKKKTTKRKTKKKKEEGRLLRLEDDEKDDFVREPHWYFLQVKPGCENHVATSIRNLATSVESDDILDVFVPTTTVVSLTKGGATVKKNERYFPGYILILMSMNRISYGHVIRITHVQCFMGDSNRDKSKSGPFRAPSPLKDSEMKTVFDKVKMGSAQNLMESTKDIGFELGDDIRVISGTMEGCKGYIVALNPELNLIRCKLNVFGVESTIEMNQNQIELHSEEQQKIDAQREQVMLEQEGMERESKMKNSVKHRRQKKKENQAKARNRINSMLGKVDMKQASVASAADDLGALLADDEDDTWDPLAPLGNKKSPQSNGKKSKSNPNQQVDDNDDGFLAADTSDMDDGFMSADTISKGGSNKSDELFDSFEENLGRKTKQNKVSQVVNEDSLDNMFSFLEENQSSNERTKKKEKKKNSGVPGLDKLLEGGDIDDIWDAKLDKGDNDNDFEAEILDIGDKPSKENRESDEEIVQRIREDNPDEEYEMDDEIDKFLANDKNKNVADLFEQINNDVSGDIDKTKNKNDDVSLDFMKMNFKDEDINLEDVDGIDKEDELKFLADFEADFGSVESGDDDEKGVEKSGSKKANKNKKQQKGAMTDIEENNFMSSLIPDNIDDLEPILKVSTEEEIEKIDLHDDGPYEVIDYDAMVKRDQERKKKRNGSQKPIGKKQKA